MNNNNLYWIGYYFGLSCIIHPETGRWTLAGMFNDTLVCEKYENGNCIDCMYYPVSEVSFILKFANPFLIKSLSKLPLFHRWITNKALEGYWVFEDKSINVIFENGPSS